MEVSGKRTEQKASRRSVADFRLYCLPCDRENVRVPAYGYCKDCHEHLCESCYKHHKKPAPLRSHVLLDKDAMPQTQSVSATREEFDKCPEHEDELKFYCGHHSVIACNICVTLDHRDCKIDYLPKVSKNIMEDGELLDIMTELNILKDKCQSNAKLVRKNKNEITNKHAQILKEIKKFRDEVNACLNKMVRSAYEEVNSLMNAEQERLETLSRRCENISKEAEEIESSLKNLMQGKKFSRLFIEMKEAKPRYAELEAKGSQTHHDNKLQQFKFVKNEAILDMLRNQTGIGKLELMDAATERQASGSSVPSEKKTVVLEQVGEIDANSISDEKECDISGMEMIHPNRIVVCDTNNRKVKCFNTLKNKLLSEITLNSSPMDITNVPMNKLAATLPDEKNIYIMSLTDTSISTDRILNVNEKCMGVAYCKDKLVVTCYITGTVIILNMKGQTITRFPRVLYSFPTCIAVNTEGTYIYVNNLSCNGSVIQKFNWRGNIVNSTEIHAYPCGIQELDDATFLVCLGIDSNENIVRMSSSCKSCKVSGHEKFGDIFPKAICYSKETRRLYVSYFRGKYYPPSIKIFKVDWC